MADNTVLSTPIGTGATIRTLQDASNTEWPVGLAAYTITEAAGANVLALVKLTAGLPVQPQTGSTWTVAAGVGLNTTLLALESGGNLAAINAAVRGLLSVTGSVNAGSNLNTALLALESGGQLAAINTFLRAGPVPVSGTLNAGTNLNTAALALEAGNLAAINTKLAGTVNTNASAGTNLNTASLALEAGNLAAINTFLRAGPVPISGTVTVNAGSNLNTSLLALEAGGNLAAINAAVRGAGTITVNAGSNLNTSLLALEAGGNLTAINTFLRSGPVPVTGTANAGTNLNTSLLALESGGQLAAINTFLRNGPVPVTGIVNAGTNLNTSLLALESGGQLAAINTFLRAGPVNTSLTGLNTVSQGPAGAVTAPWPTQIIPGISGGLNFTQYISGTNTNNTSVKGSAGQLYEIIVGSICTSVMYLKLYDKATAPNTAADTPKWTLAVPASANVGGLAKTIPEGLNFPTGIGFALVLGIGVADATCTVANTAVVNLGWK